MSLDMTGPARYKRQPHYRRYLSEDHEIVVICVQDFDYRDYDASRFLDKKDFPTREEARYTPIDIRDQYEALREATAEGEDLTAATQVLRNFDALQGGARWR